MKVNSDHSLPTDMKDLGVKQTLKFKLVFHPIEPDDEKKSEVFAEAVRDIIHEDNSGEVRIVCPYLSIHVLQAIIKDQEFRLITDLNACFESQVDLHLFTFIQNNLHYIRHCPDVHAKIISTNTAALVGSANLTKSGFAKRDEMGCLIYDVTILKTLCGWFNSLWSKSSDVGSHHLQAFHNRSPRFNNRVNKILMSQGQSKARGKRSLGWISKAIIPSQTSGKSSNDPDIFNFDYKSVQDERQILVKQL